MPTSRSGATTWRAGQSARCKRRRSRRCSADSRCAIHVGDITDASTSTQEKQTLGNLVRGNYITHAAAKYRGPVGIFIGYTDSTTTVHNELEFLPYTGISIGCGWVLNRTPRTTRSRPPPPRAPRSDPPTEAIYHDNSSESFVDAKNVAESARYLTIMHYGSDTVHMAKNVSLTGNLVDFDDVLCGMAIHGHTPNPKSAKNFRAPHRPARSNGAITPPCRRW